MHNSSLAIGLIFVRRLVAASLVRFMAMACPDVHMIPSGTPSLGLAYRLRGIASANQHPASAK